MEELTGLVAFDWMLVFVAVAAVVVVASSLRQSPPGSRVGPLLIVPSVVGLASLGTALGLYPKETGHVRAQIADHAAALAGVAVVLVVSFALVDLVFNRLAVPGARYLGRRLGRPEAGADAALALSLIPAGLVCLLALVYIHGRVPPAWASASAVGHAGTGVTVVAQYDVPGHPLDLVFTGEREGYMTIGEGRIVRFRLPAGDEEAPRFTTVATGLRYPRGVALLGRRLFVAELGPLPCPRPFPVCKGDNAPGGSAEAGERRILRGSRGRVLAYDVRADGTLTGRRTILDRLPVVSSEHGVNGVTAGPDGRLYVSIGHVDRLHSDPAALRGHPNAHLLGTIVSVKPDGSDLRVVARGLRNAYDLTFDPEGRLYAADNDGDTRRGWRREEIVAIRDGANYGYPFDGTFAPYTTRTDPPLWVTHTKGSAGVEWVAGPQLIVGSCGAIERIALTKAGGEVTVARPNGASRLVELPGYGCVTGIEPDANGRLFATVFRLEGSGQLIELA